MQHVRLQKTTESNTQQKPAHPRTDSEHYIFFAAIVSACFLHKGK